MEARHEINYFTDELYRYYFEHGKTLSREILNTLDKTPLELSDEEKEVFVKFILPRRHQIKQALKARFINSGAKEEVWHTRLLSCSQSIVGQIAAEMLIEEEATAVGPIMSMRTIPLGSRAPSTSLEPSNPPSGMSPPAQPPSEPPAPPAPPPPPAPPGPSIPPAQVTPPEQPSTPAQPEKEIPAIPHISSKLPSYRFPEVPEFETPEELSRKKGRKRTASLIGSGIAIGVVIIMTIIGLITGTGRIQKEVPVYVAGKVALPLEITSPSPSQSFETPNITVSGRTGPEVDVMISIENSGENVHCRSDAQGDFSADITLAEGDNSVEVVARGDDANEKRTVSCQYVMDFPTYKALCQNIDFGLLSQNPDAYKGQKYFATGCINQISGSGGSINILLDVTRGKYGIWTDTICVSYGETIPAHRYSVITIYGEIQGSYSSFSPLGRAITLPLIKAKFIELVER